MNPKKQAGMPDYNKLINELHKLNNRWYNGVEKYHQGVFNTPERMDQSTATFSEVCNQAAYIWEQLEKEAPLLLQGIDLLPEPESPMPVKNPGKWEGYTYIPYELLEKG